jgi:hypothetical protein
MSYKLKDNYKEGVVKEKLKEILEALADDDSEPCDLCKFRKQCCKNVVLEWHSDEYKIDTGDYEDILFCSKWEADDA